MKKFIAILVTVFIAVLGIYMIKSNEGKMDNMPAADSSGQFPVDSKGILETNGITYKGFAVVQKSIRIKKGSTVTWINEDDAKHDVTPETETADFKTSKLFGKGETYQQTFNTVGTFAYNCSPHPYMKGTIEVVE